jgi:hypothetical protein
MNDSSEKEKESFQKTCRSSYLTLLGHIIKMKIIPFFLKDFIASRMGL